MSKVPTTVLLSGLPDEPSALDLDTRILAGWLAMQAKLKSWHSLSFDPPRPYCDSFAEDARRSVSPLVRALATVEPEEAPELCTERHAYQLLAGELLTLLVLRKVKHDSL